MYAIAVHAGAGFHSKNRESAYKNLCISSCKAAEYVIKNQLSDNPAIDAAVSAISVFEDSYLTNAGFGSSLTIEGKVECDAGLMCGKSLEFCSMGSLSRIKNPIQAVKLLLYNRIKNPPSAIGRVKPMTLCGEGALKWALKHPEISLLPENSLVSSGSERKWNEYLHLLRSTDQSNDVSCVCDYITSKRPRILEKLDTVGAVCLDQYGNICSAVSSGGIALKESGRLGHSCMFGCGCWAEVSSNGTVGVVTSGTGEQLVKTQFAQKLSERLLYNLESPTPTVIKQSFNDDFLYSRLLSDSTKKFGAAAGILYRPEQQQSSIEFIFAHSTDSFAYAYIVNPNMSKPLAAISRKDDNLNLNFQCFAFKCN